MYYNVNAHLFFAAYFSLHSHQSATTDILRHFLMLKTKEKKRLNGSTPELLGCAEKQTNKAVIRQKHKNKICTDRSKVRGSTKNNVLSITKYMFL